MSYDNPGFARHQMQERLLAQAELCEHIASACADESSAQKFRQLARECQASAAAEGDRAR